jgi:hypothetical protein
MIQEHTLLEPICSIDRVNHGAASRNIECHKATHQANLLVGCTDDPEGTFCTSAWTILFLFIS